MREIKFRAWMNPDKVMLSHEELMSIPVTYHDVFEGNSKYPPSYATCYRWSFMFPTMGTTTRRKPIKDIPMTDYQYENQVIEILIKEEQYIDTCLEDLCERLKEEVERNIHNERN